MSFQFRQLLILVLILSGIVPVSAQLSLVPFVPSAVKVTDIANCGDDRLFIVEQSGIILVADLEGNLKPLPFLDINERVQDAGGEQGLLGLAFSPDYATDHRFYVNYINNSGNSVIARFLTPPGTPDRADSLSEEILFIVLQPYTNHNGGAMHFGPDGFLYLSFGDGGAGGDPQNHSQDLSSRLGKLLRIDVHASTGYSVPPSNPFVQTPGADSTIWNYGLRNAWRFSFDRLTGDKWIADVGQNAWEEIDFQEAASQGGENYGWRCYEGNVAYNLANCPPPPSFVFPIYVYDHPTGCSVTGGYVYRGAKYNAFFGKYFFVDYCSGVIQSLTPADTGGYVHEQYGSFGNVAFSTFGEDRYGEMYIGKNTTGVYKMVDSTCRPVAFIAKADTIIDSYSFRLLSTPYHPGYIYQWYFNGTRIPGASNSEYLARLSGNYQVQVASSDSCFNTSKKITLLLGMVDPFGIFPNPVVNEVQLIWSVNMPGAKEIRVYDSLGRLWLNRKVEKNAPGVSLDLSHLAQGTYVVEVEHLGNVYTRKLVKL